MASTAALVCFRSILILSRFSGSLKGAYAVTFYARAYGERFVVRDGDASGAHQFQNREERSHGLAAPPLLDEQLGEAA